jgi:hypothetical protein
MKNGEPLPFQTRCLTEAPHQKPTSSPRIEGLRPGGPVPEPGNLHIHVPSWLKSALPPVCHHFITLP